MRNAPTITIIAVLSCTTLIINVFLIAKMKRLLQLKENSSQYMEINVMEKVRYDIGRKRGIEIYYK
jgi:hypothetical protein